MSRDFYRNGNGMSSSASTRNSAQYNIQRPASSPLNVDKIKSFGRLLQVAPGTETLRNRARVNVHQTCQRQEKRLSDSANYITKTSLYEKHDPRQLDASNERGTGKEMDDIFRPDSYRHKTHISKETLGGCETSVCESPATLLDRCDDQKRQSLKTTRYHYDTHTHEANSNGQETIKLRLKLKTDERDKFDHREGAQEKQYDMELGYIQKEEYYKSHVVGLVEHIKKRDNEIEQLRLENQKNAAIVVQLRATVKENGNEIENMRLDHYKNSDLFDELRAIVAEREKEIENMRLDHQKNAAIVDRLQANLDEKDNEIEKMRLDHQNNSKESNEVWAIVKEKEDKIVKMQKINIRAVRERQESERRSKEITKEMAKIMKTKGLFESCDDEMANTMLADKFRGLYDKEWAKLCKWLSGTFHATPEIKIIENLSKLMKLSYLECLRIAESQIKEFLLLQETAKLPSEDVHEELFYLRKKYAQCENMRLFVRKVVSDKAFPMEPIHVFLSEETGQRAPQRIKAFLNEFIDCCWLMVVSKPAMSLIFDVIGKQYGEISEHFTIYSTKNPIEDETKVEGTVYEVVWPSVCLKDGSAYYKKGDVILVKKGKQ